jgi:general secretion pathway protein E
MIETSTLPAASTALADLPEDKRNEIVDTPRARRFEAFCAAAKVDPTAALDRLATASGLPVVAPERFDLERISALPVRIVLEYHCVPITPEADAPPGPDDRLDVATSWPPEPVMDEWIHASCGREVRWHLAPGD